MKKQIKKWGNSLVITFNPEDSRIHNLTEGKIINVYLSDNEETMILDYSLPCPLCSITIHGNSWVDVNEKFKIHIKSCKQRNHNQGEITSGDSESFKRNQHPDALNEENKK